MADIPQVAVTNEREIQPFQLSLEQLNLLKSQHEEELQQLQRQGETLIGAKNRFHTVRATLNDLQQSKNGNRLLVPLNSSLYVPGFMVEPEKVK
jgi:prefoldin alpha subunit